MKTTEGKIAVMQAYADGKTIECRLTNQSLWTSIANPGWDWTNYDYRVKTEPPKEKIVPYESAEEFLEAQKEHGMYIKERDGLIYMPTTISDTRVVVGGGSGYSYNILSTEFHFLDGTPCGKEVEV